MTNHYPNRETLHVTLFWFPTLPMRICHIRIERVRRLLKSINDNKSYNEGRYNIVSRRQ